MGEVPTDAIGQTAQSRPTDMAVLSFKQVETELLYSFYLVIAVGQL